MSEVAEEIQPVSTFHDLDLEEDIAFCDEPVADESPAAPADLPVGLDRLLIANIIAISSSDDLRQMFADFERQVEAKIAPLNVLLDRSIMSAEVLNLKQHGALVNKWRHRLTRYASFANAFVEHGKSSPFLLDYNKSAGLKPSEQTRDAYRRSLTAGYTAFLARLEGLIDDIDSRVNLVKKYLDDEESGHRNTKGGRF